MSADRLAHRPIFDHDGAYCDACLEDWPCTSFDPMNVEPLARAAREAGRVAEPVMREWADRLRTSTDAAAPFICVFCARDCRHDGHRP